MSRPTRGPCLSHPYGTLTLCGPPFQTVPVPSAGPLASSAFARRYSRSRGCFPFLRLLRCFSSPGSPHRPVDSDGDDPRRGRVSPFGHPGIDGRSHLPRAFRSVPRPSSPLGAEASTRCPCFTRPAPPDRPTRSAARDTRLHTRHGSLPRKGRKPRFEKTSSSSRCPNSDRAGRPGPPPETVVGPGRFERPTSRLSGVRSDRLSYGPGRRNTEGGRRRTRDGARVRLPTPVFREGMCRRRWCPGGATAPHVLERR